jgi:small nuclear ribonucleoprotein D3
MADGGAASTVGVPVRLLKEAEGHVITGELRNGEIYRGKLEAAEDTMNVQLSAVIHTGRDGKVTKLENVYLRGSQIRFILLPELLRHAPLFR